MLRQLTQQKFGTGSALAFLLMVLIEACSGIAIAQPLASRRVALVIANEKYQSAPELPNTTRDALAIADRFKELGFSKVTYLQNLTREGTSNALRNFRNDAISADWAIIYYAGHGIAVGGINYVVPTDASLNRVDDVDLDAVSLRQLESAASPAKKLRLIIMDACRDNPFANKMLGKTSTRSISRGLASVETQPGSMIVFAAKDGQVAADGDDRSNSPFAAALLKYTSQKNIEVRKLFEFVRDDVLERTQGNQQPFVYASLSAKDDFYFNESLPTLAPNTNVENYTGNTIVAPRNSTNIGGTIVQNRTTPNPNDIIYFQPGSAFLSGLGRAALEKHVRRLKQNSAKSFTIEGHSDEDGSREYNFALGAQRAVTVKQYLLAAGISDSRMQTISYGREKPIAQCSSYECRSQNDRVLITLK